MGNSQPSYFSPQIFVPSPNTNLKGLINPLGENNCFLNVVIQSLWHLDSFRTRFEGTEEKHQHSTPYCVFCALQDMFVNYAYSDEFMIPPTDLRRALSMQFAGEARFQIGEMYDATETLVAVLGYLHSVFMGVGEKDDEPCEPRCLVHQVFSMNFCDRTECPCGATSEPALSSTFIYPIYVTELRRAFDDANRRDIRFDELMSILNDSELKKCPDFDLTECQQKNRNQRFLQNVPRVFTINLVWASPTPTVEEIRQTLTIIAANNALEIDLSTIFYGVERETNYVFRGMIAYYGRHYAAFFHCRSRDQWLIFDDEKIKVVGKTWDDVIANCCRAHWQPSVLFYERRERSGASPAVMASPLPPIEVLAPSTLKLPSMTTHSTPDLSTATASSSFTSTSVSVAIPCAPASAGALTTSSMRRSLSDYSVGSGSGGGSPSRHYTPTAPINIGASMGSSLSQLMCQRGLVPPTSKNTAALRSIERNLLLGSTEKEMEKEDLIISSPVEHGINVLDDVLPPLVASPSADMASSSYRDIFALVDEWHATKRDLHPRAHADCREHQEAAGEVCEGKGKEGKLVTAPSEQRRAHRKEKQQQQEDEGRDRKGASDDKTMASMPTTPTPRSKISSTSPQQGKGGAFSCEFVIGQVDMREKEFRINRAFEAFSRRWLLVLERSYRLDDEHWGSDKRGYEGYITVRVQRLDPGTDVLRLAVSFECRVQARSFASAMPCVAVQGSRGAGDPYFICPQRQRQYLTGRKELGLSLSMRLLS